MKKGTVYYRDTPAGVLEKVDGGYVFRYIRFFDRLRAISV